MVSKSENKWKNPVPTVDIILWDAKTQKLVLIKRKNEPHGWALPGGFVDYGESLEQAAVREAKEETSLDCKLQCQFHSYSDPCRDRRLHSISTVFIATATGVPEGQDDALEAHWFSLEDLPYLVFDHSDILNDFKQYYLNGNRTLFLKKTSPLPPRAIASKFM